MSDPKKAYFLAAGASLKMVRDWQNLYAERSNGAQAFLGRNKALGGRMVNGIIKEISVKAADEPGKGWKRGKPSLGSWAAPEAYYWSPDKRIAEGKLLAAEANALALPDASDLNFESVGFTGDWLIHGGYLHRPGFELIGDKVVLVIPYTSETPEAPTDSTPLSKADYLRLQADAEEAEDKEGCDGSAERH